MTGMTADWHDRHRGMTDDVLATKQRPADDKHERRGREARQEIALFVRDSAGTRDRATPRFLLVPGTLYDRAAPKTSSAAARRATCTRYDRAAPKTSLAAARL